MIGQGGKPLLCCPTCYDKQSVYVVMVWQSDTSITAAIKEGWAACMLYCPRCGHLISLPARGEHPEDTPDEWAF